MNRNTMGKIIVSLLLLLFSPAMATLSLAEDGEGEGGGVTVRVRTVPPGATVKVDGVETEHLTPVEFEVEPGAREVVISLEGYDEVTRVIEARPGEVNDVRATLHPTPEHAAEDKKATFEGGYAMIGMNHLDLVTSSVMLEKEGTELLFRDVAERDSGLLIMLRYVRPLDDNVFLLVDAGYQDVRFNLANPEFPEPVGEGPDIDVFLMRGTLDFSLGVGVGDNLMAYLGAGGHYSTLYDEDETGLFRGNNLKSFQGYTLKGGGFWDTRYHVMLGAEYQYHWSYEMEDFSLAWYLGYHF